MFHVKRLDEIVRKKAFKRILIKVSGESFAEKGTGGIDFFVLEKLVDQLVVLSKTWEIALVLGAGNFFRGASMEAQSLSRGTADQLGMLATVMNGLALQGCLLRKGIEAIFFSSLSIEGVAQKFFESEKDSYFGLGRVVIFSGGVGQPYFTTDTAAVLWALRSDCEIVLKGTQVDGVYSADPLCDEKASFFPFLTYDEVLEKKLRVMDFTALTLAQENHMPLLVFNIHRPESILKALRGEPPSTWICETNRKIP